MKCYFAALGAVATLGLCLVVTPARADGPTVGPVLSPPGFAPPPPTPDSPQPGSFAPPPAQYAPSPPPDPNGGNPAAAGAQDVQVQTRGPVHDAFAEPFSYDPKPSVVIPAKPPEPINEVPPDMKPEGNDVVWIPGYWAWDDDRKDFLWVSGLWRKVPPGRRWVPGYWVDQDGGSRWVAGVWVKSDTQEIEYLPPPPQSLEQGPNVAAPSDNHIWMPGSWVYVGNNYRWRPGFWSVAQENWIWIPPRYVWTPRGMIFVAGYWDYQIVDRGMMFAPAYISAYAYRRPGFFYSPSVVISLGGLSTNLFVGIGFGHYYFGDYYGDAYYRRGFYPWFDFHLHHGYDPMLNYYSWHYRRQGIDYMAQLRTRHDDFILHVDHRPPRTYAAQLQLQVRLGGHGEAGLMFRPMREVAMAGDNHMRIVRVPEGERREIEASRMQTRQLSIDRGRLEHNAGPQTGRMTLGPSGKSLGPAGTGQRLPPSGSRLPYDPGRQGSGQNSRDKKSPWDRSSNDSSGRGGGGWGK